MRARLSPSCATTSGNRDGAATSARRARDRVFERLGRRSARLILSRDEPVRLVALAAIGSFGYHARIPILDILGLVDATIAQTRGGEEEGPRGHLRSNADYVLARRPDYILIARRPAEGQAGAYLLPAIRDLHAHPDLVRHYRWDERLGGYRRKPGPRQGRRAGALPGLLADSHTGSQVVNSKGEPSAAPVARRSVDDPRSRRRRRAQPQPSRD